MLRSVTLGIAISVLAEACALVEPPPPAGTTPVLANVKNESGAAVELGVRSGPLELPNAAQPAFIADGATVEVTFYLPPGRDWWITVNRNPTLGGPTGVGQMFSQGCRLDMELRLDGASMGCQ